jgi:competence protein ComFB
MKLKNYQEDLVIYLSELVLKNRHDVKASESLLHDVAAYTLNRLPPRYIVSERGFTRLAADHWVDLGNEDGLASLVQVLILVNQAVDTVMSRRREARPGPASRREEEAVLDLNCCWHNLPYLIGRVLDKASRHPVLEASVRILINGKDAEPADPGWLNPYRTNAGTRGFFSFLPKPISVRAKSKRFTLTLAIEHPDYEPLTREQIIQSKGELITYPFITSDRILNLGNSLLAPKTV